MASSKPLVAARPLHTLAAALLVIVSCLAVTGPAAAASHASPPGPTVRTIVEHLSAKSPPYKGSLNVPQLSWSAGGAVSDRVNLAIIDWVEGQVKQFAAQVKTDLAHAKNLPSSLPESSLHLTFHVTRLDAKVLSVRFEVEAYVRGAASPSQVPAGLTFSLATGSTYTLASLFRPGATYLPTLARLALGGLKGFRPAGAACYVGPPGPPAKASAFTVWWLTGSALVLSYPAGQYTAAYCGPPTVSIPGTALAALLAPGGPLAG